MAENHTQQNRNTGAGFHRQRGRKGGTKSVLERHVIALDGCWCGEPLGHDWSGKEKGAPHPQEKEQEMSTMAEQPTITPRDLRGFDKPTTDLLMEIINDFGTRYRIIDGGHILLYPPDGVSRPFKVSAARQTKVNKQILEVQFMQEYGLVRAKPEPEQTPEKKEQPVVTTYDIPEHDTTPREEPQGAAQQPEQAVEVPEVRPDAAEPLEEAMRAAIATLTDALGIESLEEEALQALDENEAMKKRLAALSGDLDRTRAGRAALEQEVDRLKEKVAMAEGLLDEAIERADKAEKKWKTMKELFND